MPELPEVETIRRQLSEVLVGKELMKIEVLRLNSFWGEPKILLNSQVESVKRKAKVIEITFKGKQDMLIIHLKMTGQLVFEESEKVSLCHKNRVVGGHPTSDWIKDLYSKHTRVVMYFVDGSRLFFNDMRVFGWIKLVEKKKYENEMRKRVPDVTEKSFTLEYFAGLFEKTKKAVKLILMDQELIGGVGNIYANDALYLAKVMPDRIAVSLSKKEIGSLYKAIKNVIRKGIKYGGASAANYVDTNGLGGSYQDHFLVYKKDGKCCDVCKGKILKMKIGGRGSFYCPNCQK